VSEPTVQEIMEWNRLYLKQICNAETLPESEIERLNFLQNKIGGYNRYEIMFAKIEELERKLGVTKEALTSLILNETNKVRIFEASHSALASCVLNADAIARQALKEIE
jgi:hypothetical protein